MEAKKNKKPKTKRLCNHLLNGVNPDIVSYKLTSSDVVECDSCRKRQERKGKAKQENEDGGEESISSCRAIWICLKCGNYFCGGISRAAIPQSHAISHAEALKHPVAMQYEFPPLLCCFPCEKLVLRENLKDSLGTILRMIELRLSRTPSLEAEGYRLRKDSVTSSGLSETCPAVLGGRVGYRVRGMRNLGNTCFFNAILQNLLALDTLRDNFCKLDDSLGPLSDALKGIFLETQPDVSRNIFIDPKSLLNSVCEKAPHFRGGQQQDSHELLRYLLDGLIQELNAKSSLEDGNSDPTFVDAIFGGQFSSSITCVQCGHISMAYEPFLDISLPIKKPSPKQTHPSTQTKKPETIPRQHPMICPKISRDTNTEPSPRTLDQSAVSFEDSALVDTDSSIMAESKSLSSHSLSSIQHVKWEAREMLLAYRKCFPEKSTQHGESNQTQKDNLIRLAFREGIDVAMNNDVTSQNDAFPENPFDFTGDEYPIQNHTETKANQVVQSGFRRKSIESQVDDNSDPSPSVETCLTYFTEPEILLKNEHGWQCEKCSEVVEEQRMILNVHKEEFRSGTHSEGTDDKDESSQIVKVERTAIKRNLIHRAPSILTIHLKRFRQDAQGYLEKMDDYVQFNPTIDLKPYMDPRCTESAKYEYHLVGVVEHAGTALEGGHYVSYVRGGTKITENGNEEYVWFHANDAIVNEVPFEKVLVCRAYILFYKRI